MDLAETYIVDFLGYPFIPAYGANEVWDMASDEHYIKIPNRPDNAPKLGDIVIWGKQIGPYGHIAIAKDGDLNTFVSFDQNWPIGSPCHFVEHNYYGVIGWLRPKKLEGGIMLKDTSPRNLGVTGRQYALLSDPAEADACLGKGWENRVFKLYANRFIKFKGDPTVYQAVDNPTAYNEITDGNWSLIKEIDNPQDLQKEIERLNKQIIDLNGQIEKLSKQKLSESDYNFLTSLKNFLVTAKDWIVGLFKNEK